MLGFVSFGDPDGLLLCSFIEVLYTDGEVVESSFPIAVFTSVFLPFLS
jgi:hypothetical protein